MIRIFLIIATFSLFAGNTYQKPDSFPMTLSEYGFFKGDMADLLPAAGVLPYEVNAPLFSDYAHKSRMIRLPEGQTMGYREKGILNLPEGTELVKTFYYLRDETKPEKGRTILETRVLKKGKDGWVALPYIWNEEQTEAHLEVAGGNHPIKWKDKAGKKQSLNYQIPNMVQCKSCHAQEKELVPIGISARQLNHEEQLTSWAAAGWIKNVPQRDEIPKMVSWEEEHETVMDRARAYLDSNCGHCHNPQGPANTSGMYLDIYTDDPAQWGVNKAPVAAGKGAGGRLYGIVPGEPNASILTYRMESTDPGEMMPELGRQMVHQEGVDLIKHWIKEMKQ